MGFSYTAKMSPLYWIMAQVPWHLHSWHLSVFLDYPSFSTFQSIKNLHQFLYSAILVHVLNSTNKKICQSFNPCLRYLPYTPNSSNYLIFANLRTVFYENIIICLALISRIFYIVLPLAYINSTHQSPLRKCLSIPVNDRQGTHSKTK